jgi:ribonuclease D
LLREARRGEIAEGILAAVKAGLAVPTPDLPKPVNGREGMQVDPAVADLLRVLLKSKSESSGVAAKLIASSADLDALAAGERDLPTLHGWRAEVFGDDALRLCSGQIGLSARAGMIEVVRLDA